MDVYCILCATWVQVRYLARRKARPNCCRQCLRVEDSLQRGFAKRYANYIVDWMGFIDSRHAAVENASGVDGWPKAKDHEGLLRGYGITPRELEMRLSVEQWHDSEARIATLTKPHFISGNNRDWREF